MGSPSRNNFLGRKFDFGESCRAVADVADDFIGSVELIHQLVGSGECGKVEHGSQNPELSEQVLWDGVEGDVQREILTTPATNIKHSIKLLGPS